MPRLPPFPDRVTTARLDWREAIPVAAGFDDVYFSVDGAIAEKTHVFIDHNRLPARFAAGGFQAFTIGETGFGTGLNCLLAARAFLAHAPAGAVLHFVSVEKFPLAAADLVRAHACWPELATLAGELQAAYPPPVAGFHRRTLAGGRIRLTLLLGDAAALLPRLEARVDAWFLDGFNPVKNRELWTPELFAQLARLSAPAATFATYSAAGEVKRGLRAAGFQVRRAPGFGRKWDMLCGSVEQQAAGNSAAENSTADNGDAGSGAGANDHGPGAAMIESPIASPAMQTAAGRAAVIGGGLAGCATARALAERGWQVTLIERNAQLAGETSGNLAGAVYPKFSVHETAQNRWYRDSYLHALARLPQVLGAPDGIRWARCGLLQLPDAGGNDLAAVAASGRWPADVLQLVDAGETAALTGIALQHGGLWFPGAAWVHPPALCRALADHPRITLRLGTEASDLAHDGTRPLLDGESFDVAVIANALAASAFTATAALPLRRVRGQVTHIAATAASRSLRAVVCHDGYVTPAREDTHCVGATFGPRDADPAVRAGDHDENLAKLAAACPPLHAALGGADTRIAGGRTGFRAQTPDYLPVIGAVVDAAAYTAGSNAEQLPTVPGLFVMSALGARGIAFSLLGAEIIAAQAGQEPLPVDREVASALSPGRFLQRARRRAAGAARRPPPAQES